MQVRQYVISGTHEEARPGRNLLRMTQCLFCSLLVALALLPCNVQAQSSSAIDEVGRFYVKNFAPADYNAHAQNWDIVQSPDGLLYVANSVGVLEYDGVSWRLIPISNNSSTRSLAIDTDGRIYVGAQGELGYLAADSLGRMSYVSLLDHIPPDDRTFADVWDIEKTSDGIYFMTYERLFRWNGRTMKVWRTSADTRFYPIFSLRDTLYVNQRGIGLMRMEDDVLAMAPGGAMFEGEIIRGLVPWGEAEYLVVTYNNGMFRCSTQRGTEPACSPFNPGLTELLVALQPFHATMLPEGRLA
ncbi:MAG: lactonase family protein, partial [bacterium]|nr:lactonase family protein [bacterium]